MKVTVYKYILRDLSTMKKVGHTYTEHGKDPVAPPGMFVSKCVGSSIKHYAEFDDNLKEELKGEKGNE